MSTVELKNKIQEKLKSIKDDALLKEVLSILEFETDNSIYSLSDAQKSAVDEARQQIKDGNFYTNDEVDNEIDAWLNK